MLVRNSHFNKLVSEQLFQDGERRAEGMAVDRRNNFDLLALWHLASQIQVCYVLHQISFSQYLIF